jgi:predicted AlkP superfamily pyrophosphatase or phosphodiesterase
VAVFNAAYKKAYDADPLPKWDYQHEQCRALRGSMTILARPVRADLPPENYNLEDSPALDETTIAAAIDLLDRQHLGRRGVTDMLGVSLSATDKIGHSYGTQGPEMCEQMYRMDAAMGTFLDKLALVPGGVVLVLTADHGGSDAPERTAERGGDAGRYDRSLLPGINEALKAEFGLDYAPLQQGGTGLIVADKDHVLLAEPLRSRIVAAALPRLNASRSVSLAVAADDLSHDPMPAADTQPENLTVRERLRLSYVGRSGADIFMAYAPYLTGNTSPGGAISSHGSVWDYDRRVPILFWQPGGQGQERFWQIRTVDIAPTLASLINVPVPATMDGHCLETGLVEGVKCPIMAPVAPAP